MFPHHRQPDNPLAQLLWHAHKRRVSRIKISRIKIHPRQPRHGLLRRELNNFILHREGIRAAASVAGVVRPGRGVAGRGD